MGFTMPEGFLFGVSTAATQIEGGEVGSNWNDWYHRGRIKDDSDPAVADDHWNRVEEDTALLTELGTQTYRFGVEWARIMPAENKVDQDAVAHYRSEIEGLVDHGIKPLLTIHHFSNPMWFEEKGGFLKKENCVHYFHLLKTIVRNFGDLVSEYITINEPNVYASNGFLWGEWSPGLKSFSKCFTVLSNLAHCHIEGYRLIHDMREKMGFTDTKVSFANHMRAYAPKNPKNPFHRMTSRMVEYLFEGALTDAMLLGKFRWPMRNLHRDKRGEYADFNAVNYYTRSTISGFQDGVKENSPRNDLDWEIYPEGLIICANKLLKRLDRPIWVTENGTCDFNDSFRSRYIYDHLKTIAESGLPFERYYHWCFMDNFEWIEGNTARFGLVRNDFDTQNRTVNKSGRFYAEIIENNGVTDEMFDKYVKDEEYTIR